MQEEQVSKMYFDRPPVRIDFLGAPGVGKTTLLRSLMGECDPDGLGGDRSPWLTFEQAEKLARENFHRDFSSPMSIRGRLGLFVRLIRHGIDSYLIRGSRASYDLGELGRHRRKLLAEFCDQHHELFVALVENWFDPDMVLPPLAMRYHDMLEWILRWLFVHAWAGPVPLLADNARVIKGIAELIEVGQPATISAAERFCQSSLGPAAVIHLECDPQVIVERIQNRTSETSGQLHPAHMNRSDRELLEYSSKKNRINAQAMRYFQSWGIPILTVNASAPMRDNSNTILTFLKQSCSIFFHEPSGRRFGSPAGADACGK